MKKWKSLVLVGVMALGLTACGSSSSAENDNKLIVGTEAGFAPYEYLQGDQVVGIDMDIAKAIADDMGKELVIKNMDFQGALTAVQSGKVDLVVAGVSVNEERKKSMDFSDPYVDSTDVIVVNKNNPAVTDAKDLDNKVIGVQEGNVADIWCSSKENVNAKEVKRYTTFAQAAQDLVNEKIDCIVMDQMPAIDLEASNDKLKVLEGDENIVFSDQYAIAVKKGNTDLLTSVNATIATLKENGKIDEFATNHLQK